MALNALGLGFQLTAEDAASGVFAKAGQGLDTMKGKAEKSKVSVDEVSGSMKHMSAVLIGVGAAGLVGLGLATNEAAKFQKSIAEVSTLVDEATFPTDKLWDLTTKLAETYGGDANVQAKALYQTISAGVTDAAKASDLLAIANKLAIGGVTDVFTSVDALTSVTAAYASTNLQAAQAADVMFTTVRLGKTTMAEIGATIGKVAPTASTLGVSFTELSAALAAVTVQGINTHEAVTGLKAAFANVVKPTSDATAEAARLGIKFDAATLRAKGFKGLLDSVTGSAKYNKDSIAKLFGSIEAFNTISALANNNSKAFNDNLAEMAKATGATDLAFEKMSDTYDFQANLLKSKLQVALIKIGDVLLPLITKAAALLTHLVDAFNNLPAPVRKALVIGLALGSAFLILIGVVVGVVAAVMAVAASAEVIVVALAAVAAITEYMLAAFAVAAVVFYGFKHAFDKNLGGFATFVTDVFNKVKLAVEAVQQLFETGGFSGKVLRDLENGNQGVEDFAVTIFLWFNRIKNFVSGVIDSFGKTMDTLGPVFKGMVDAFRQLGVALGFVKDGPEEARGKFEKFGAAGAAVGEALAKGVGYLVKAITAVVEVTTGWIEGFKSMGPVLSFVWGAMMQVWDALKNVFAALTQSSGAGDGSNSQWKELGKTLGIVGGVIGYVVGLMISGFAIMLNTAAASLGGIMTWLAGFKNMFVGAFNVISGLLTGNWALAWYGAKQILFGVIQQMVAGITAMLSTIAAQFDGLAKKVGKDLGLQKAVEGFKADALKGLETKLGLDKPPPGAPAPAPPPGTAATPLTGAGGPIIGAGFGSNPLLPATSPAAAAAAGAAAMPGPAAAPPPAKVDQTTTVNLLLDGETLASVALKKFDVLSNRGFGPTVTQK